MRLLDELPGATRLLDGPMPAPELAVEVAAPTLLLSGAPELLDELRGATEVLPVLPVPPEPAVPVAELPPHAPVSATSKPKAVAVVQCEVMPSSRKICSVTLARSALV